MTQRLVYVEFDQPFCANTYGSSPCTAALGVTGDVKCYNSRLTCQDRPNYVDDPVTLRFSTDCDYLPSSIEAIPSIVDWSVSPGIISIGEDLGLRAEMRVTLRDHPWPDTGPGGDKYIDDRIPKGVLLMEDGGELLMEDGGSFELEETPEGATETPFDKGTFWGKWRARVRYMRGRPFRLIIGEVGQTIEDMEARHFIIENVDGPDRDGNVTLIGKDPLKLADGDRAQCPTLSRGYLQAEITDTDTSATLAPAGIGDGEYPASGYVAIGGSEICAFTRSGDVLTLTRAQYGTEADEHDAEDRVQVCKEYIGQDAGNIVNDLFTTFAGIDEDYIPLTDWLNETSAYSGRVFSAFIAEPTDVSKLVSELIQQAGMSIWWDEVARKIRLRVLRQITTDAATFDEEIISRGTFRSMEQPNKRASQVWCFYGQRNPLKKLDDEENYRSAAVSIDSDAEVDYGSAAIKKIYSRWIAAFGRSSAERTCNLHLGRYRDPPRRFNFSLFRDQADEVQAGQGYQIAFWPLQNEAGDVEPVPIQITRFEPGAAEVTIEAEEATFTRIDPVDLDNRTITIDTNTTNFNLRSVHDSLYPAPETGDDFNLTVYIQSGAIVGGSVLGSPSFDVGDWTGFDDVVITIVNNGRIQGRGGAGGAGHTQSNVSAGGALGLAGEAGSTAFYSRRIVTLENAGEIWGGGGGGGAGGRGTWSSNRESGGGGGGAGYRPGDGGTTFDGTKNFRASTPGTTEAGGAGGYGSNGVNNSGGAGGGPASAGQAGRTGGNDPGKAGGAAGKAVDGDSYITWAALGDIKGVRDN